MGEGVEQRELYLQGQKMRGEEADLAGKAVVRMPHVPGRGAGAAVPDLMQGDELARALAEERRGPVGLHVREDLARGLRDRADQLGRLL